MTIRDAIDINNSLRYLLAIDQGSPEEAAGALDAAKRLAARANKALQAGLNPDQVASAWPPGAGRGKGGRR